MTMFRRVVELQRKVDWLIAQQDCGKPWTASEMASNTPDGYPCRRCGVPENWHSKHEGKS